MYWLTYDSSYIISTGIWRDRRGGGRVFYSLVLLYNQSRCTVRIASGWEIDLKVTPLEVFVGYNFTYGVVGRTRVRISLRTFLS